MTTRQYSTPNGFQNETVTKQYSQPGGFINETVSTASTTPLPPPKIILQAVNRASTY